MRMHRLGCVLALSSAFFAAEGVAAAQPLFCAVVGNGGSFFARMNFAEYQRFASTRTDFNVDIRFTNFYDPGAFPAAFNGCGADGAAITSSIQSYVRPEWLASATNYPGTYWVNLRAAPTSEQLLPNTLWFVAQEYRAWYVKGYAAGLRSATGHVGMLVYLDDNPQMVQATNAFLLGLKAVNPNGTVMVASEQNFLDPTNFIDDLMIDTVRSLDPLVDTFATQRARSWAQDYVLRTLNDQQGYNYAFVENEMTMTMDQSDLDAMLGDPRVLTASVYDYQPLLNHIADQYLAGTLQGNAPLEYAQDIGHAPIVDIARLSSTEFSHQERQRIEHVRKKVVKDQEDPFCGPHAAQWLSPSYTFVDGCMSLSDRLFGTRYFQGIGKRVRCEYYDGDCECMCGDEEIECSDSCSE